VVHDAAIVCRGAAGTRAALESQTRARARIDGDVDAIPVPDLLSEVVRKGNVVIGRDVEPVRFYVVETAHHVSAAARKPRIDGRINAERIEVGRAQRAVIGDDQVAEPGP